MPMRPPAPQAPPTVAPAVAPTVPQATVQQVQPLAPSQPAPSAPPVIPTVQAARWGRGMEMWAIGSINSHYFHIIGDGHQPNSRGFIGPHYKDSLLKVG